jgi:anti-sigma factor RsiW
MDCREFDERLDALLDGKLPVEERQALTSHAAGCARCRELASLLSLDIAEPPAQAPEGLAEAILARTTGSPCGRARDLMCDLVDGRLDEPDAEIVKVHLEHCRECASHARALARLREQLPSLAEVSPGERFLEGVLARTSRGWRKRMAGWRIETAERWRRILARPRLAAEGAYLGSLLVTALVMVPGSPLRGLPDRVLAATRGDLVARAVASDGPMADVRARATALHARAREAATRRLAGPLAEAEREAGAVAAELRELQDRAVHLIDDLRGGESRTVKNTKTTTHEHE